ncbi:MAG: hypothetical protein BWY76_02072 [bacterium ADurb.Bin429]|nr:MAG: hypothetical protein BWY76_02072 [bacterium ADurb.Bin429]
MPLIWETLPGMVAEREYHPESFVSCIYRAKIPGGWLVRLLVPGADMPDSLDSSMVFVPDPRHEWDGNSLP